MYLSVIVISLLIRRGKKALNRHFIAGCWSTEPCHHMCCHRDESAEIWIHHDQVKTVLPLPRSSGGLSCASVTNTHFLYKLHWLPGKINKVKFVTGSGFFLKWILPGSFLDRTERYRHYLEKQIEFFTSILINPALPPPPCHWGGGVKWKG
jgi:hypothetical protein